MDVLQNRTIDDVIVLGSGLSISKLTPKEIDYINHCKTVIALNKFMAFYKLSGILPTHVFFMDKHENSLKFLNYIFERCIAEDLRNLTFIVHEKIKHLTYRENRELIKVWITHNLINTKRLLRKRKAEPFFNSIIGNFSFYKIPPYSKVHYLNTNSWLEGGDWATSLNMKLYHYRGSLTSVLNYITIAKPGRNIYLVGNDFNSSKYFFQKELDALPIEVSDWTSPIIKQHNKHFSAIEYEGTTIFDKLPFILEKLQETGNSLFSNNSESLLVTRGKVTFKKLPV